MMIEGGMIKKERNLGNFQRRLLNCYIILHITDENLLPRCRVPSNEPWTDVNYLRYTSKKMIHVFHYSHL